MKKKLIALAVGGALLTPMLVQAETTLYGRAHLSYGNIDDGTAGGNDNWQLRSHASRFGIKGDRDLGSYGLKAIYKFEWQIDYEQDADAALDRRNMYAGLKGGWGELRFGRHDTPLKMAQGKFDQFGDTDADLKNAGDEDGENRLDNVLAYLGKTGSVGYAIALIPAEGDGTTSGDGVADTISASISYNDGPLYLALAHDSYDDTAGQAENSLTRFVSTYKISGMQFGLLYQTGVEAADSATAKEDWLGVSFNTKIGEKNKLKAQYIMVEDNQTNKLEGDLFAVGIDHNFDKNTTGYVMYSNVKEEQAGVTTKDDSFLGVGMILKF